MNKSLVFCSLLLLIACAEGEHIASSYYTCSPDHTLNNASHPRRSEYEMLLSSIIKRGVPGILMSVDDSQNNSWTGADGKADLYNDVDLQACNITRVGSTVKMFTAVTVLKLVEEGKLDLDDRIADYLQGDVISKIENAETATVRQLLQHSSGIYNYIQNLRFQTASLNEPTRVWKVNELLHYAYNKPAYFKPGDDVIYSNTNYIMLGMLIENVEGKAFYKVFEEKIFTPLNMESTRFAAEDPIPHGIIRGYIDLYSNLNVIESTNYSGWDYYTADGGLISNPYEMNLFFKALMEGRLIGSSMLSEMLNWKAPKESDPEFFPIHYGMGIFKMDTQVGEVYFHSGDAIGYYANMMYLPEQNIYVSYAVNGNYGKIDEATSTKRAIADILSVIVPWD